MTYFLYLSWRSGASTALQVQNHHCPSTNCMCVRSFVDSRKIYLHQSLSQFSAGKYHQRTTAQIDPPHHAQEQSITTLLFPRTSKRRCVADGNATFHGSLSSRGLFERSTGGSQTHEDSGGFKFNMTCQEYSNSFVSESHSVHVFQASVSVSRRLPRIA